IRERLEPAVGVGEDRLFAFQPDVARSGERGVRSNQGAQRLLVVSVERLVELGCEDLGISGNGRHSAFLWNPSKNSRPSLSSGPHAGSLTAHALTRVGAIAVIPNRSPAQPRGSPGPNIGSMPRSPAEAGLLCAAGSRRE